MKFRPIVVDSTGRELNPHGTEGFPMSMDRQLVSEKGINGILHWHDELQISYVIQGRVCFETLRDRYDLAKGEAIFFNQKCLHKASMIPGYPDGQYVSLNFLPRLIYGYSYSQLLPDYVTPILTAPQLEMIPLSGEAWNRQICAVLECMIRVEQDKGYGYELHLKAMLNEIWYILVVNQEEVLEKNRKVSFYDRQRMNALLKFIHKHYHQKLSLDEIAQSVHISRGECCRLFKRSLDQTPFGYLNRYRISRSQKLLSSTKLSILEISQQCGFNTSSYFSESFRKDTGMTPGAYRKKFKH